MRVTAPTATANTALPDWPPAVAVTVALPVCPPVASPFADTLTMEASELDQVTVCPVTTMPEKSVRVSLRSRHAKV